MMPGCQFDDIIKKMPKYLQDLTECPLTGHSGANSLCNRKCPTNKGIYVFYERGCAMYVGRSDRLKRRLREHGPTGKLSASATFVITIAKKCFEKKYPDRKNMTRKALLKDKEFKLLFRKAVNRVRKMGVRVVEVNDPIEQTIFEVYAHVALETPYNDFRNH